MKSEPTPFELATLNKPEYEVWARQKTAEFSRRLLPYLLIVLPEEGEKPLKIIDPRKNNDEIFSADNYLDIVDYLREEGYAPVKGRMQLYLDNDDDEVDGAYVE